MAILIIGSDRAQEFLEATSRLAPERDVRIWPDAGNVGEIRHALAWHAPHGALKTLPNLETIVSVGAGVDHLFADKDLPDVPVVRYVDPDLTGRMMTYIVLHTLLHTRRTVEYQDQQTDVTWQYLPEPAPHQVRVGIMGLGVLGTAAADQLVALGYQVRGWSRTPKQVENVKCFAGEEQQDEFLRETDVLAVLLPLTPQTRGMINGELLGKLSRQGRHDRMPGPVLINAGRGELQREDDILAALEDGSLYAASLDVFETEPLPAESRLWRHPRVIITPHIAAESTVEAIASYFLSHVRRVEAGEAPQNVVDPLLGY